MKRLPCGMILFFLCLLLPASLAQSYTNLSVSEAKAAIDSNPTLVVLDVRTQSEYDDGHIRNAKLIPHTELSLRLNELNQTDEILVYCRAGSRSAIASQILVDAGFQNIYNMLGGILDWIDAGYPVYVKYSSIQVAINNAFEGDTIRVSLGTYYENVVVNKTVSLIGENRETTVVSGNGVGNVLSIIRENVTVAGFTINNSGSVPYDAGIYLDNASFSIIEGNAIKGNLYGIMIYASSNYVTVKDNNITINDFGIRFFSNSHYGNISRNYIADHSYGYGIGATSSNYTNISGNIILNNYAGILLGGIITGSTSHNVVFQNIIDGCEEYGIEIGGYYSQNNIFYHNNLVNNNQQVLISPEVSHPNFWDNGYPSGGNYWSDYNGTDSSSGFYQNETGPDRIGDSPYVISGSNQDNYPLIYPYGFFPWDVTGDDYVGIDDIVAVAEHFGQDPVHPDWDSKYDINGDNYTGIDDIVLVAEHFGESI
ncbi:MAG: right-handed parallel beta-helix repeat-containing protein [Candidatus Bathyarchaeota archaeon]|nr:MAG: right-handed parallel beta-helix repeat-containing protein [Candidatus Bathyarchaeota archaeon]